MRCGCIERCNIGRDEYGVNADNKTAAYHYRSHSIVFVEENGNASTC